MQRIAIIGAGKVGCNLAGYFLAQGLPLAALIDPVADPALLPPRLRTLHAASLDALPSDADLLLIAVPDGVIASVAGTLARLPAAPGARLVAHCSGLRTSDELLPLAERCITGSLHPVQSFNSRDIGLEQLRGIGCGIEGGDAFAEAATAFAHSLGWHPVRVRREQKALYHAACVLAGNLSLALLADARALLQRAATEDAGGPFFEPMLRAVFARAETAPVTEALTGPVARGDDDAIAAYGTAITTYAPEMLPLFEALIARARGLRKSG